jgi:malate dehydrogenase (oxaloacetate-decarboxylating)(NADP+)
MKLAATHALAALTKEDVPDSVCRAYGVERLTFGPDYIIPKPFDPRVLVWEASAVARAAVETGVAQEPIDMEEYREQLEKRLGKAHGVMRLLIHKAQHSPKRVVFPEGENEKVLRACHILLEEGVAAPILLGNEKVIRGKAEELGVDLRGMEVVDVERSPDREAYANDGLVKSFTATNSIFLSSRAARRTLRPMRPNPLIPTLIAITFS